MALFNSQIKGSTITFLKCANASLETFLINHLDTHLMTPRYSHTAYLLSVMLLALSAYATEPATHLATDSIGTPPPQSEADQPPSDVITVTGRHVSSLRDYGHLYPGLVAFNEYHALAPQAPLRWTIATLGNQPRIIPIAKASLIKKNWIAEDWVWPLEVSEDGWFSIPLSRDAYLQGAEVEVSRKSAYDGSWLLDVKTPGLPPHIYRLGDLRLMCMAYIAINWSSGGRGRLGVRPEKACLGPDKMYFNATRWPEMKGYRIVEGDEQRLIEKDKKSLPTFIDVSKPDKTMAPWSPNAMVEFIVSDGTEEAQ